MSDADRRLMAPRCRNCRDGTIVTLTSHGRVTAFCTCERGREAAAAKDERELRAALLAAFRDAGGGRG